MGFQVPGGHGENNGGQRSPIASVAKFLTHLFQRHGFATFDVAKAPIDCAQSGGIREDLCRLLESVVFIHRDQNRSWTAAAGHHDVLPQVGDAINDVRQIVAQLTNRYGIHLNGVHPCVHNA